MATRFSTIRAAALLLVRPFSSSAPLPPPPPPLPSAATDEAVISSAVSVLRDRRTRSRSRWNYLHSLHHSTGGFSPSQSSAIVLRLRNNPRLALRFFLFSHRRRLCSHTLSSYATIIHVLARSRLRPAALSLLLSAIRLPDSSPTALFQTLANTYRACDSAPFVFDLLIRAYLQSKKLDSALLVARRLLSHGISPLPTTSNSLIRSTARARGSVAGLTLYRELFPTTTKVSPKVQTFNTLLLALYQEGTLDAAAAALIRADMAQLGCIPNAFTYSILMAGLCDVWRVKEARDLWEEMTAKGIKPDVVAFNTLIGGYCNAGEVMSAEELFVEMGLSGIEPTCTTFEHLVSGHCKAGNVDTALAVFEDMRRRGHRPEVTTVDEMIEEMCERGRVAEGLGILRNEMKRKDGGFGPSRTSYELLIGGFCKNGEVEEALRLQAEMAGRGFESGPEIYGAFIEAYNQQGDAEKAEKLRDEMLQKFPEK